MRRLLPLLALLIALPAGATSIPFTAAINESQAVPPSGSPAFGTAVLTLDDVTHLLQFDAVTTNVLLQGPETAAQIHFGPVGSNGPAIADLPLGPVKSISIDLGLLAACSADVGACETTFKNAGAYVLLTTEAFGDPQGEIRGQINPVSAVGEATAFSMLLVGMIGLGGFHWLIREKPIH